MYTQINACNQMNYNFGNHVYADNQSYTFEL